MRYMLLMFAFVLFGLVLTGCGGDEEPPTATPISMPVFRYDAARDVVIVTTVPLIELNPMNSRRYVDALRTVPEMSYAPAANLRLADPAVRLDNSTLIVNYQEAAGLDQLAAAQVAAIQAALEGWFWTPGITAVRLEIAGRPATAIGPITITQPLPRTFHTYIVQPQSGEVAYMVGSLNPATPTQAAEILRARSIREFPATRGFVPLLPPEVTMTLGDITEGVLPVNLSANFPTTQQPRLAGLVLNFTQFPAVRAVRFTFGGQTVDALFGRSNLNRAITPYDLLLSPVAPPRPPEVLGPSATN